MNPHYLADERATAAATAASHGEGHRIPAFIVWGWAKKGKKREMHTMTLSYRAVDTQRCSGDRSLRSTQELPLALAQPRKTFEPSELYLTLHQEPHTLQKHACGTVNKTHNHATFEAGGGVTGHDPLSQPIWKSPCCITDNISQWSLGT